MYSRDYFHTFRIVFGMLTIMMLLYSLVSVIGVPDKHPGPLSGFVIIPMFLFGVVVFCFSMTGIITLLLMVEKGRSLLFPMAWSCASLLICAIHAYFMYREFKNPGASLVVAGITLPNLAVLICSLVFRKK